MSGVVAFAVPIRDAAEQAAGFALNVLSGHAFCNVVNLDGSCFGRSTLTFPMFAWEPNAALGYASSTCRLAPFALDVFPDVETLNCGLKPSTAQLVTWNGTDTLLEEPSTLDTLPVTLNGSQFVGLNVNPGRVVSKFTCLICNGIPSRMCGIA
jgi:hypothetical protein